MDIVAGVTIILFFIYFITREKKEKKIIKIFAVAFFIALISIGCASLEAEESETKNKVAKVEKLEEKRKKGIKLELNDVSEENKGIFYDNFYIVEEGFQELTANREDLQSAKMAYFPNEKRVDFTYYYTPNPNDIDISSSGDMVHIHLTEYNFIGKILSNYYNKLNNEFRNLNVDFEKPGSVIYYEVDDDNYLVTDLVSQFNMRFGVQLPGEEMVEIEGQFASASGKSGIPQPRKNVSGDFTSEYSLIEFFYQLEDEINFPSGSESQGDKNINPSNVEEINKAKEPINKKSSNLHIQDYLEGVNELSWENIELYIMRRPGFEEGKDYEVYDYYLTTPEHLLIYTDKNDNIMQITWESEEPLGQDESSNLEWIILSLDEDISIEEVNDFLVSKEFVEENFGDFKVEFINYGSSFKFNAYIE